MSRWVLTLSCPDRIGIVAAVSGALLRQRCNIVASAQFGDARAGRFFMRVCFDSTTDASAEQLSASLAPVVAQFHLQHALYDTSVKPRMVILVSRIGHCLHDLLYRLRTGELAAEVVTVVSNHADFRALVEAEGIRFIHLPIDPADPAAQEVALAALIEPGVCDLVVLARYMRVLSARLCAQLRGRAINIHHSFLPSFQGARPYHRAHERGVKLIGATAHYVTEDLDEGPIIEQDVVRVNHAMSVADYVEMGRDVECRVLARAVKWHLQHRILMEEDRTIVFP